MRSSSSSSRSTPRAVVPYRPPLPPTSVTHHVDTSRTLGQSIKDGFGLGVGSGIGHAMVSRVFGLGSPTTPVSQTQTPKEPCEFERKAFELCLTSNNDTCHNKQFALTECLKLSKKDHE